MRSLINETEALLAELNQAQFYPDSTPGRVNDFYTVERRWLTHLEMHAKDFLDAIEKVERVSVWRTKYAYRSGVGAWQELDAILAGEVTSPND